MSGLWKSLFGQYLFIYQGFFLCLFATHTEQKMVRNVMYIIQVLLVNVCVCECFFFLLVFWSHTIWKESLTGKRFILCYPLNPILRLKAATATTRISQKMNSCCYCVGFCCWQFCFCFLIRPFNNIQPF